MKQYRITFGGRIKGAIGLSYSISAIRSAESPETAVLALYDDYEHISFPKVTEVNHAEH